MTLLHYLGDDGNPVPVSASNPIPMAGGGGGGMTPEDITAAAPLSWDPGTATMQVSVGAQAGQVAAGNHSHTPASIGAATAAQGSLADTAVQPGDLANVATSGSYLDLTERPSIPTVPVAAHVDPETGTVADVINALIAAGLMASA